MRLGIQLLDASCGNPNSIRPISQLSFTQGDTVSLYFQLVDLTTGLRHVPSSVALVQVSIPRLPVVSGTLVNVRQSSSSSVDRMAEKAFCGDWSVWCMPITSRESSTLTSGAISVTLVDGANVHTAVLPLALSVTPSEGA